MLSTCGGSGASRSLCGLFLACRSTFGRCSGGATNVPVFLSWFSRCVSTDDAGGTAHSSKIESTVDKKLVFNWTPRNGQRNLRNNYTRHLGFGGPDGNYMARDRTVFRQRKDRWPSGSHTDEGIDALNNGHEQERRPVIPSGTAGTGNLVKDFYAESPDVSARSQVEIDKWLDENEVTLRGNGIPRPVFRFSEAGFPDVITDFLCKSFEKPTVIQSISWPIALSGRDVVSIAMTGSGKTLAFMIPGIVHTSRQPVRRHFEGPSVLVLLPTRELAQQVQTVCSNYCRLMGLRSTCVYGGSHRVAQARALNRGVDVLIATPGRLLDFLATRTTSLRRCSYLVLDEADRMLDMGFEPQIRKIISQTRRDRQTLMFSATWPEGVRALAKDFHTNQAFLNVGSLELAANHNITQVVKVMEENEKQAQLASVLKEVMNEPQSKTLVFVQTKKKADDLTRVMRNEGWDALCIHGDKSQRERDWVLSEFKSGRARILLATDVAARGLDVNDIKCVVNYDYPKSATDYVHRIGRTGRCENKGVAYTFFTREDAGKASDLVKVLEEAGQNVPKELVLLCEAQVTGYRRRVSRFRRFSHGARKH